jgi:hypothetical protein
LYEFSFFHSLFCHGYKQSKQGAQTRRACAAYTQEWPEIWVQKQYMCVCVCVCVTSHEAYDSLQRTSQVVHDGLHVCVCVCVCVRACIHQSWSHNFTLPARVIPCHHTPYTRGISSQHHLHVVTHVALGARGVWHGHQ